MCHISGRYCELPWRLSEVRVRRLGNVHEGCILSVGWSLYFLFVSLQPAVLRLLKKYSARPQGEDSAPEAYSVLYVEGYE